MDRGELKRRLEETIKKECSDVNVALLLAAALHSEEEIRKGRAGEAGEADAACVVADELIGIDIAEYIRGKKALFNFIYYDTRKPGILSRLGVFMDDAIGGLIAGCMSSICSKFGGFFEQTMKNENCKVQNKPFFYFAFFNLHSAFCN